MWGGIESICVGSLGNRCQDESLQAGEFFGSAEWGEAAWMEPLGEWACGAEIMNTFAELTRAGDGPSVIPHQGNEKGGALLYLCNTSF